MTDEAETCLRLIAEAELSRAMEGRGARRRSAIVHLETEHGLRRLQIIADALAGTGQLDADVAASVVAGQEMALTARRLIDPGLYTCRSSGRQVCIPPAGQYQAVGIGAWVTITGQPVQIGLLALVLAPGRTILTLSLARPTPDLELLCDATAVDSRGTRYRAEFSPHAGQLELVPPLRPGPTWLDVTFQPTTDAYRISLDPPAAPPVQVTARPPERTAEHYLDAVTEHLLRLGSQDQELSPTDIGLFCDALDTLTAIYAIEPDDQTLRRLVTVARRRQFRLPAGMAEVVDTDLPPFWQSVLNHEGAQDGPEGIAAVAAVLPELDGRRWVVAGLRSGPTSANLRVLSWGVSSPWRLEGFGFEPAEFTWRAHDNSGRWHFVSASTSGGDGEHTYFDLELTPAIDPTASSLDVILTGRSGTVMVAVPLKWVP